MYMISDVQNNSDTDLGFNIFEERKNTSNDETINALSSIFDAELRFNDKLSLQLNLVWQLDKASEKNRLPIRRVFQCV